MSFEWPLMLLSLLVVPLALGSYVLLLTRPAPYPLAFTNLDVLAQVVDRSGAWRRYLPPALFLLALASLCVALARPQAEVTVARENATIVLTIDSSGSMLADDVAPTRLGAAQAAVKRFLQRVPKRFLVGMVTFASEPQVVATPTRDRELVHSSLGFLGPARGTAIGDAVARAGELAHESVVGGLSSTSGTSDEMPGAILLLSDGEQTTGLLSPLDGAARAKRLGLPVYTIALGTPKGVLDVGFGPGEQTGIPVPPDPDTLRAIAEETGGEFFEAPSAEALTAVYDEIGERLSHEPGRVEVTFAFAAAGAALALAAGALSLLWSGRLP